MPAPSLKARTINGISSDTGWHAAATTAPTRRAASPAKTRPGVLHGSRAALSFFAVALASLAVAILSRGTHTFWRREPGSALDWSLGAIPLVAAVASGLACNRAAIIVTRDHHAAGQTLPRVRRVLVAAVLPWFTASCAATVVATAITVAWTETQRDSPLFPHTWPLLFLALAIEAGSCLLGAAVGVVFQGLGVPLILTGVELGAFFLCQHVGLEELLKIGGSTGSVADSVIDARALLWWVATWLAIGGCSIALMAAALAGTSALRVGSGVVCASLGALSVAALPHCAGMAGVYRDTTALPHVCSSAGGIRTCVRVESGFSAPRSAAMVQRDVHAMAALGVSLPRTWYVTSYALVTVPEAATISANSYGLSTPDASAVASSLVQQAASRCTNPRAHAIVPAASVVVSSWMSERTGTADEVALSSQQSAWLRSGASDTWVKDTMTSLSHCTVRGITSPPGWQSDLSGLSW